MSLHKFKMLLEKAAVEEGIEPKEVTRRMFRKQATGQLSDFAVRSMGGFTQAKARALGNTEPHPISTEEIEKKVGHEKSEFICTVIRRAAKELAIPPHEITFSEFSRFCNMRYGVNDQGIAKYIIVKVGGFNNIRDAYFPPLPSAITVDKRRLQEQARMNRKLGSMYSEYQYVFDRLEDYAKSIFFKKARPLNCCKYPTPKATKRILNVVLSDLHFGADLDFEETSVLQYGRVEEARRMAAIAKELISYKLQYRDETEIEVLLIGDIVQNQLHDARDGAVLAEQAARSIHILIQFITILASHFKNVRVRCATGNHGRFKSRHSQRATLGKYDSIETVIYTALKYACVPLTNVSFFIPKTPFVTYDLFGKRVFATHGDTVLNPGNPSKSISISSLENQTNRVNAHLTDSNEYSIFVMGHVHIASMTMAPNGAIMITNGPLIPPDPYAVSLGIFETQCGQWLWEAVEGHPVGDVRFLRVNQGHDKDESLDNLITPWEHY